MLASFQPARCNSEVFLDSLSNDILLRGYNVGQKLLIGFSSNVDSTINITRSNMSMMKATLLASNIGVGTATPSSNVLLHVAGNTRVEGNLIVNGTVTNMNTDVRVTDQFTVCNDGTGPALIVTQLGAQPVVEFRDDNLVVFKVADGGFITIGSNNAQTKLDVEGHTTVRGTIFTSNVVTSNVQTNSLTSFLMTNHTTITSNLFSSNLIINNQTIIGSNGVITNSNFLPPFNTSNIVAGQFTSNFFLNDNVVSSKLESNLVLKGTTTMSSNVFINNGDLRILGSNNFLNVGDQARVFLGSNDYFVGASRGVGLVFQVPGTTYPMVLENNSGFVGVGVMDPQENIHIGCNAKIDGNVYVMSNLAVGRSNPSRTVDIVGTTRISDTVTLLDDLSIMSNNGAWSTQSGRQLYMRYSTNSGQDASYIQSIDRSSGTTFNMAVEGSNIAIGPSGALSNPTIYAQSGGRVGIGTSNPEFNLHLQSSIADGVRIAIDNENTAGWTEFNARNTNSGTNSGMRMGMIGNTFTQGGQYFRDAGFLESDGSNGLSIAAVSNTGELRFYTGGNTERARIRASGNVGIGTNNPLELLQVSGKIFSTQQHLGADGTQGVPSFAFRNSSNTGMFLPNTESIGLSTKGVQRITVDSNGLVGIGLTSPTYRLDVSGDIHTVSSAFVAGSNAGFLRMLAESSNTYIQSGINPTTNSAAPLIFSTINNGTEWARFNSNGNFGLGTTTPTSKLDVSGRVNITNTTGDVSFLISNNTSPYMQITGSNSVLTLGSTGTIGSHSTDAIIGDVVIKNQQTFVNGKLILQTGNSGGAIVINSNNTVGIGTPTPIAPLMVSARSTNAPSNNGIFVYNSNNSAGNHAIVATQVAGSNAGNPYLSMSVQGVTGGWSVGLDNTDGDKFKIMNSMNFAGTPRLTIDSNGNFGINNTTPKQTFDVTGIVLIRNGNTAFVWSNQQLQFGYSTEDTYRHSIITRHDASGGVANSIDFLLWDSNVNFSNLGTTNTMSVTARGVGVNTSNPTHMLDVVGNTRITLTTSIASNLRLVDSNQGQRISLHHTDTTAAYHGFGVSNFILQVGVPTTSHSIQFGMHSNTSFIPVMDVEASGSIGIGTTSPTARLHVNGDVLANSNIRSSVGTLGPSFSLVPENSFIDVSAGNQVVLNSLGEAGNPATGATRPLFYGSSFLYQDASGEDMKWNFARLIFRGCPLSSTASTSVFSVQDFISSRVPQYSNLTSNFTLSNDGQGFGYVTYGTPWFGVSSSNARSIALNLVSNSTSSTFRVGQVQIQFRT